MTKKEFHIEHKDNFEKSSKLNSLKEIPVFTIPENYFDDLEQQILAKTIDQKHIITNNHTIYWFKISAISSIAAAVLFISYFYFFKDDSYKFNNTSLKNPTNTPNQIIKPSIENKVNNLTIEQGSYAESNKEENIENKKLENLQIVQQNNLNIDNIKPIRNEKDNSNSIVNQFQSPLIQQSRITNFPFQQSNQPIIATSSSVVIGGKQSIITKLSNGNTIYTGFLGNDTCFSKSIKLDATFSSNRYNYTWSDGSTNSTLFTTKSGIYWVKIFTSTNEIFGIDTIIIRNNKVEIPDLGPDQTICSFENIVLDCKIDDPLYTYKWSISDKNESKINVSGLNPGVYKIKVNTFYCGQTNNDDMILKVSDCALQFPNVITPNNDGINDRFIITGLENFPGSSIYIMDRSGKIVYENLNYQNNWEAENLPAGTYYFLLRRGDQKKTEDGGTITVIR